MPERQRLADAAIVTSAAIVSAVSIAWWHSDVVIIIAVCAAILALLLARFHERRDLAGLFIGATVGNAVELVCDAAGVWRHANQDVMGLAPLYILLCYPILGVAVPRLIDAVAGSMPRELHGSVAPAAALLIAFVALSVRFHDARVVQSLICAVFLTLALWQFNRRHDLIAAITGAALGLVWEIPATLAGAWSFPDPQVFGLLPVWLPAAYAIFFVLLCRLIAHTALTAIGQQALHTLSEVHGAQAEEGVTRREPRWHA